MKIFDTIPPALLGLIFAILVAIGKGIYTHFQNKEAKKISNKTYREQVKQLVKNRKKVSVSDIRATPEKDLWILIEGLSTKSKGSYKNFMGLLRDYLLRQEGQKILEIYLGTLRILVKINNHNLYAAFTIISNSIKFRDYDCFGSWLLTSGQVRFNNSINNPNLIKNIEIKDITDETIIDLIMNCYEIRTRELIPELINFELHEVTGEPIELEDLPDTYPDLWEKFIVIE